MKTVALKVKKRGSNSVSATAYTTSLLLFLNFFNTYRKNIRLFFKKSVKISVYESARTLISTIKLGLLLFQSNDRAR
ncbi:hypothetical protein GCM10022410_23240 [Amphibacillus indicireducens]|uniref:Transposase n=1 Tax=Amphibacillus indicireducens TaxID=1076330 RepID=A0ABP7VZT2_9BACI